MRFTTDSKSSKDKNVFGSFAFHERVDENIHSRRPPVDVVQAIHKNSNMKSNNQPKRIVESDDDEDNVAWVSSRDTKVMTEEEKKNNARVAVIQRKKTISLVSATAPKPKKKVSDFIDCDDEELTSPSPVPKKRKQLLKTSGNRIKKEVFVVLSDGSDSEQSASSDSSNDDENESADENGANDEDGDQWNDSLSGKKVLEMQAEKILKTCESISANLRSTLKRWGAMAVKNDESTASESSGKLGELGCLNFVDINTAASVNGSSTDSVKEILDNADISAVCPKLVLKPYQMVGVNWLKLLHQNKINGVLADDMGLGKTVQTIAFLGWLKSHLSGNRVHLIVVPASTLSNWQIEFQRFCPSFRVATYQGTMKERSELRYEIRRDVEEGKIDVILSTYTMFERESSKDDRKFIYSLNFEYLVLDEAHCIKNANSSRYVKLAALQARNRLLLSGTPVQNDVGELLALLSFLMPKTFNRQDCELLLEAFDHSQNGSAKNSQFSIGHIRSMLAPFVLRRVKCDVLDQLVEKKTVLCQVSMTDKQLEEYERIILNNAVRKERLKQKFEEEEKAYAAIDISAGKKRKAAGSDSVVNVTPEKVKEEEAIDLTTPMSVLGGDAEAESPKMDAPVKMKSLSASEARHLFTALRKAANHPLLLRIYYNDRKILNKIAEVAHVHEHFGNQCDLARVQAELENFSDFDLHCICLEYGKYLEKYQLPAEVLYNSPKLCKLREMLPKLMMEGHRMLIFSQWTRLLDLLEVFLEDMSMRYLRLDGSTPVRERQRLIDTFNQGESIDEGGNVLPAIPVFLLSTKAGGLGINLTSADTVIMHDLDFNPENDKQAEDRCHRIGQTRQVTVYKLVTKDTVDEDIYEMGERKSQLSSAVLADKNGKNSSKQAGEDTDCDIGAIGRILQRALARASHHSNNNTA